jgi:acylphosphatase
VQGVGFRWFVQEQAAVIGVSGWVRNLDHGGVEAYAIGTSAQLDDLAARIHKGPAGSDVRGVEQREAEMQQLSSFRIR